MKHRLLVAVCLVVGSLPVFGADRLTDADVKALVARVEDGRDKFDNALDDKFKDRSCAVRRGRWTSSAS